MVCETPSRNLSPRRVAETLGKGPLSSILHASAVRKNLIDFDQICHIINQN